MGEKKIIKYAGGPVRYNPNPEERGGRGEYEGAIDLIKALSEHKGEEETGEEMWGRFSKEDLARARMEEIMAKMRIRKLQNQKEEQDLQASLRPQGDKNTQEGKDLNKKYDVNLETGVITVTEPGEGEHTYRDALIVSSSIKGKRGEYEGAIDLIKAAQALGEGKKDEGGPRPKKEWDVEDDGEIIHDPENGELTLSEARAVSASRRKRVSDDTLSPDRLELRLRDLKDEWDRSITEMEGRLRQQIIPRDEGSPFTLDEKGNIDIKPSAKVSLSDFLILQLIRDRQHPPTVLDEHGNLLKVPDTSTWLEVQRFEREERRKDRMNEQKIASIEDGRKLLPGILESLRGRSKETEQVLKESGWGAKSLIEGKAEVKTSPCPNPKCTETLSYTSIPSIVVCKCGTIAFFGTQEQYRIIQSQMGIPKEETKPEEGKGGELRETESPLSSDAMSEDTSRQASD